MKHTDETQATKVLALGCSEIQILVLTRVRKASCSHWRRSGGFRSKSGALTGQTLTGPPLSSKEGAEFSAWHQQPVT